MSTVPTPTEITKYQRHPTKDDVVIVHITRGETQKTFERKDAKYRRELEAAGKLED